MAERRMFAKTIVLSDAFLDMPLSARCLYFTLGMLADDDGFINSPRSIMRQCGASDDDMRILLARKFVIAFESGVIVIKHWRINNYLRNDRYKETVYTEEYKQLTTEKNGAYTLGIPSNGIPSIGKDSIGKNSIEDRAPVEAVPLNDGTDWLPTLTEYEEYKRLYASVNVANEFKKIRAWCLSNPAKRKTKNGVKRFVNAWLAREQDKPKRTDVMPSYMDTPTDEEKKQYTAEELERLING
jgi:hypothetical protein